MIPPKGATPEGTQKFQKAHKNGIHPDKWRMLKGWQVSSLGLGTYLGAYDDKTDQLLEETVGFALSRGCNFIDTAVNYRCQRSERVVGRVLKRLIESKVIQRNQVVVSTKGGFIPFDSNPVTNMEAYIRKKWFDRGIITPDDIVASCHCMHPAYLQEQIDLSLSNLGLDTIDIYYLHNPETQLPVTGEDVFYDRLTKAFSLFEENAAKGKIQCYGLATWTAFREPAAVAEHISLDRVVEAAKKAGGAGHHFQAIQLPYNMAMLEAVSISNQTLQGKSCPIFPAATAHKISVMTSAPLLQGQLLNLPSSLTRQLPNHLTLAQKALQFVVSTPGVCAAMAGMKEKEHVEENLKVLARPNWDLPTLQKICELLVK
ncbi:MAG: aldo/keto reductase [Deltaproteobacteria bacterium]|nr:aldo/keto reductase [Deltaproteobacteria bacterium]